jgi:hypothetical protein
MKIGIGIALVLALSVLSASPTSAQQTRGEFCGIWQRLCNKTCLGGPGTCGRDCSARYNDCRVSSCFFFNYPGPRCENSPADQAATRNVDERMRKGLPVGMKRPQ